MALVAELSSAGWARLELYHLFYNFLLRLPDDHGQAERLELLLDQISGWCRPALRLLPDEPINQLGIVRRQATNEALISNDGSQIIPLKSVSDIFCIGKAQGNLLTLRQASRTLYAQPENVQRITYEGFYLGDYVQTKPRHKASSPRQGRIFRLLYHYRKQQLLYYLTDLAGKKISKRYFAQDLQHQRPGAAKAKSF